jgi:hypothetical protein
LAWQNLRAEYPNAGENVRGVGARRRELAANASAQPTSSQPAKSKPAANQQISADTQQP